MRVRQRVARVAGPCATAERPAGSFHSERCKLSVCVQVFCVKDVVRTLMRVRSSESMTLLHNALAGGLTGLISTLASCPIELVKCRTQGMLEIVTGPSAAGTTTTGTAVATSSAIRFDVCLNAPSRTRFGTMPFRQGPENEFFCLKQTKLRNNAFLLRTFCTTSHITRSHGSARVL